MDKSKISVRGKLFEGKITKMKTKNTAHIEVKHTKYIPKYERYLIVRKMYPVHVPDGLVVEVGDLVLCGETRKISKTKSKIILKKLDPKNITTKIVDKPKTGDVE
jgi:ribosomal protein S17